MAANEIYSHGGTLHDEELLKLRDAIAGYVEFYVVRPAIDLVETDFSVQDDIASLLVLHRLIAEGAVADGRMPVDEYLRSAIARQPIRDDEPPELRPCLTKSAGHIAEIRTVFCSYVFSLANSICISLLSASYLSAFTVTRTLLELLVNVGAGRTGKMSEKIADLGMLADDERKAVSECWRELCGWTHPYGKWVKNLCPVLVAKGPLHHPQTARDALTYLGICTDLAFAIAFDKFSLSPDFVRARCIEQHVDFRRFMFLRRRVNWG